GPTAAPASCAGPAQPASALPAPAAGAPRTCPPAPAPTSPHATNHAGSARTTRPWRPPHRPPQAHTHPDHLTPSSPPGPLQAVTAGPTGAVVANRGPSRLMAPHHQGLGSQGQASPEQDRVAEREHV